MRSTINKETGGNAVRALCAALVFIAALSALAGQGLCADDPDPEGEFSLGGLPFDFDWWSTGKPPEWGYGRRLSAPFESGNNHFLQHLVLIPPPEGFRTVPRGKVAVDIGFEALRESKPGGGPENRFIATYLESGIKVAYGLSSVFEIRGGFTGGWFHPDSADSFRLTQEGVLVTPEDGMNPSPGIGNALLSLKILSAFEEKDMLGLSTILTLKIPVGKKEFLSSGRGDFSIGFAGSARIVLGSDYHAFVHANAGVSFFDEENAFPRKVYLNPVAFYSLSLILPFTGEQSFSGAPLALGIWAQGNANVFRKLDALNSDPVSVHGGLRIEFSGWTLDISAGGGANKSGAADVIVNVSIGSDF